MSLFSRCFPLGRSIRSSSLGRISVASFILSLSAASQVSAQGPSSPSLEERPARNGLLPTEGRKEASQPIPQAAEALTALKVQAVFDAWAKEKLVEAYEAIGRKDAKWDAPAREVILDAVRTWTQAPEALEPDALLAKVKALEESGCDDPLVRFICARVRSETQGAAGRTQLPEIIVQLESSQYSPAVVFLARVKLWQLSSRNDTPAAAQASLEALRKALAERPLTADDSVVWHHFVSHGDFEKYFDKNAEGILDVLTTTDGVPDWLKHRLRGRFAITRAWDARGAGRANTVTEKGWEGFGQYLVEARQELTKAWELNPKHPSAATQMITVAMGAGKDPLGEMRLWFERAVQARFDNPGAYNNFLGGVRPRWHGSHAAMIAFGRSCAATGRYDTEVPGYLLRAARMISYEWDDHDTYYAQAAPYAELRDVCVGYIKNTKSDRVRRYYLSQGAVLAVKCRKFDEAREFLKRLDYRLNEEVAKDWQVDAQDWPQQVLAASGPLAKAVAAANQSMAADRNAEAAKLLTAARQTPNLLPAEKEYLERQLGQLAGYQRLDEAKWEEFRLPATNEEFRNEGWRSYGKWRRPAPETIKVEGAAQHSYLYHPRWKGQSFELRGEIEFVPDANGTCQAAILYGPTFKEQPYMAVRFENSGEHSGNIRVSKGYALYTLWVSHDLGSRFRFSLRIAEGMLRVQVNGETLLNHRLLEFEEPSFAEDKFLAIGTPSSTPPDTVLFHDLEIRQPSGDAAKKSE